MSGSGSVGRSERKRLFLLWFRDTRRAILEYLKNLDKILVLLALICTAYGCVLISSAVLNQTGYVSRSLPVQLIAAAAGAVAMIIISAVDYGVYRYFWGAIGVICIGMLLLTLIIGQGRSSADDAAWIRLGRISVQPSEMVKLGFSVTFACHCYAMKEKVSTFPSVILLCVHGIVPVGLVALQDDLGSAVIFMIMFFMMMFAAGIKLRYFAAAAVMLTAAVPIVWNYVLNDFHRQRILIAFTPEADPLGIGYQQYYGRMAIGSGQLTGQGLFNGTQTQSGFISEAQNDYIFAVAGEELGFLGAGLIILLLTLITVRSLVIAFTAKNTLGRVICVGVASMFGCQTVVNLGMCLCLLPVVGVTLPFFSSGGSSIVTCWAAIGLVESVRIHSRPKKLQSGGTVIPD